jgi:hypothetical protein
MVWYRRCPAGYGTMLVVNGRWLQKGEAYRTLCFFPSSDPWLLLKAEWRIGNGGLYPNPVPQGTAPAETPTVGGGVMEGWAPSPPVRCLPVSLSSYRRARRGTRRRHSETLRDDRGPEHQFYVVRAARGAVYADPVGGNGSSTSR